MLTIQHIVYVENNRASVVGAQNKSTHYLNDAFCKMLALVLQMAFTCSLVCCFALWDHLSLSGEFSPQKCQSHRLTAHKSVMI